MDKTNEIENEGNDGAIEPAGEKTALVTIIGRPSAGKSTFLNTAAGEPVSIVSAVPQTTRNAIKGIVNTSLGQLVFVDTPGWHDSDKKMNLRMRNIVSDQLDNSDLILYIIDGTRACAEEERLIAEMLEKHQEKLVIALNKTDEKNADIDGAKSFARKMLPAVPDARVIAISAKNDEGINDVLRALYSLAPVAPHLYSEEFYTDQEVDFRIAEVIREQAMNRLDKELPHCIYVKIADMEMRTPTKMWCRAFLCVETESQKGIVIGKGAQMIKTIRVESIKSLRKIFDWKIELDLQVKVDKNWRQKDIVLDRLLK
ncbi:MULTISPECIES: GTPase Era [Treponema]|uniref:GTPase Era n=1 Tax=Treponema saccharophilum DSM 2985 TaxID=907348 RepID=H7ENK6_9SPIR|nr:MULTISPECIES: GTPase Era [Treponema]EIC00934.1 GTP-binding protein Era [Treponema saccharophilum DSM 2985]MBQ5537529.1 GTPase Era [Treponema sp.]BDC95145.1 GTPase Era [Treponema saccharophilum]